MLQHLKIASKPKALFIRNVLKPYILLREFLLMKLLLSRYWQVPRQNKSVRLLYIFPKKTHGKVLNLITSEKEFIQRKYPLDKDFEFFSSPYDEGDGYEMRAVSLGKCNFASFYYATGGHIMIQIDEKQRIKITYEDRENIKISQSELDQKLLKIFDLKLKRNPS